MSFFFELLNNRSLTKHDGRPLWKYSINEEQFHTLTIMLQSVNFIHIDSRDVFLYYAYWWKLNYNGGKPNKQEVFDSIGRNDEDIFTKNEFYQLARTGAERLGIRWIKKQNTLYFKTLLLQGDLPLKHISENQGSYKAFLEAVLDEQPEKMEDFIFKSHIIDLLPISSQNDIIYENCFEIVKSILSGDGKYDDLFDSDDSLKKTSNFLKEKKKTLSKKVRQSKPKNYWLLSFKGIESEISLRLGFADAYNKEALSGLLALVPFTPLDNG
jgi:hypothetical protein